MKKQTLFLLFASFVLLCIVASCSDKESNNVSIADYPLISGSCDWGELVQNKVYVINSVEDLDEIVVCPGVGGGTPPAIDFETRTLIVLRGVSNYGIEKVEKTLRKDSNTAYTLEVNVKTTGATILQEWTVAIVTNKLDAKATVVADIKTGK